jgi:hypothetical protein
MTAVEWLIFHWLELDKKYYGGEIGRIDYRNRRDAIQSEAKEMEKQQIINAHGIKKDYSFSQIDPQTITGEQYFNETFKNTNK